MPFIIIQRDGQLTVSPTLSSTGVAVPIIDDRYEPRLTIDGHRASALLSNILQEYLSREADAELSQRLGATASYYPVQPDSWLVVVALLMWDSISQGLPWDAVKFIIGRAIQRMQGEGVAPSEQGATTTERKLQIHWSTYLDMGRLFKLHNELKIKFDSSSENNLDDIPRSDPKKPHTRRKRGKS